MNNLLSYCGLVDARVPGIIFLMGLQLQVLLEITKFHLHKSRPDAGIIRNANIIGGRALHEEIRYLSKHLDCSCQRKDHSTLKTLMASKAHSRKDL